MNQLPKNAFYIGDGIYAAFDSDGVPVLVTFDGYQVTNEIYLDSQTVPVLRKWLEKIEKDWRS